MSTIRKQILAQIKAALTGTAGAGARIYRSRAEAFSRSESIAILIEPIQDMPSQNVIDYDQNLLNVRIAVIARGAIPDDIADDTVADLHAKLMADFTLGGLAQDIQRGPTSFQIEEADQTAGVTSCQYNVMYRTQLNDLSAGG